MLLPNGCSREQHPPRKRPGSPSRTGRVHGCAAALQVTNPSSYGTAGGYRPALAAGPGGLAGLVGLLSDQGREGVPVLGRDGPRLFSARLIQRSACLRQPVRRTCLRRLHRHLHHHQKQPGYLRVPGVSTAAPSSACLCTIGEEWALRWPSPGGASGKAPPGRRWSDRVLRGPSRGRRAVWSPPSFPYVLNGYVSVKARMTSTGAGKMPNSRLYPSFPNGVST